MRKLLLVIWGILLIGVVSAVEQGVIVEILRTGNVSINEVEINPVGSDTGNEWIEIFNNGNPVDISGWYITDKNNKKYFLQNLTIIDFFVIEPFSPTLINTNQNISLYDNKNRLVDSTGVFSENVPPVGDDKTFSRVPDGSGSFVLQKSTKGITNVIVDIRDKTNIPACIIERDDISLYANVSTNFCIDKVIFSVLIEGRWINFSGIKSSGIGNYSVSISGDLLPKSYFVDYTVYAIDCLNKTFSNGLHNFYVNARTNLDVNPSLPDGLNGWYTTEPEFSLENIDSSNLFYRWDSTGTIDYNMPFGLENSPNNGDITGGILELTYWSDVCETENEQNKTFMFDFTNPVIKDLEPANNSNINNPKPDISAVLDEVYRGNSGIDSDSVEMFLDGRLVDSEVRLSDRIDAVVSFEPETDLAEGNHTVRVNVNDNSGRNSETMWMFEVNRTNITIIDMAIYLPLSRNYSTRRIEFNISINKLVDILEFIDYNDRRPRFMTLCRNCHEYGNRIKKSKTFSEGWHNITIRATDRLGNDEENIVFFIDSQEPRIVRTEPRRGFANGKFLVEFNEENPLNLFLNYGNRSDLRNSEINPNNCIEERRRMSCESNVNLSDFDGNEIFYLFNVSDIVGNFDISKIIELEVDISKPVINSFNYSINGRRVRFVLDINEKNFDFVSFVDLTERRPRERRLCSRLNEGICDKTIVFGEGRHDIMINVFDEAGNKAMIENLVFVI